MAGQDLDKLTEAAASAMWVPGQEGLLAGYRDRYFTEALPVRRVASPSANFSATTTAF